MYGTAAKLRLLFVPAVTVVIIANVFADAGAAAAKNAVVCVARFLFIIQTKMAGFQTSDNVKKNRYPTHDPSLSKITKKCGRFVFCRAFFVTSPFFFFFFV